MTSAKPLVLALLLLLCAAQSLPQPAAAQQMSVQTEPALPLPEHPRPDFERPGWVNLNGPWAFRFDSSDVGLQEQWADSAPGGFDREITVPFPWGAPLSGLTDEAQIGWYARTVTIPEDWGAGQRIFLNIGAADWHTTAWIDGTKLGTHQGGYTPFSFELTPHVQAGQSYPLVVRVDDVDRPFTLEGKQGYGDARGIWQTPYLEARGAAPLDVLHFTPDLEAEAVTVEARLLEPAPEDLTLTLNFPNVDVPRVTQRVPAGSDNLTFTVPVPEPHLWSLEDPFLYNVTAQLAGPNTAEDEVRTYFGMREISVVNRPGTEGDAADRYVALNGEPVYLELALDQAYHPEGFYTFPSDDFVRNEVLRARQIGLNGLRVHIKVPLPRKLYWADRLGMLIMADVPNGWGEPNAKQRQEVDYAMRQMIKRDYNHPSIFSWILFNETWGLRSEVEVEGETQERYLPETQQWVVSMVEHAQKLDSTRLIEDNSVCCGVGHTVTDLNTWHAYLPGWAWPAELDSISAGTYPGSTWNFEEGYRQARQPNLNSEFGNVWGYEGSTGDVDYTWDYHRAIDAFRRHPKIAGWLYTEHHDVVNEWNGYWRYDRSEKITGLEELAEGMTLRDLHAPLYIAVGDPAALSQSVEAGAQVEVPLWASFMTGSRAYGETLTLHTTLYGWNTLGEKATYAESSRPLSYRPWRSEALDSLSVTMPETPGVAVLATRLEDEGGTVLQRNFTTFVVEGPPPKQVPLASGQGARVIRFAPSDHDEAEWSLKSWEVLDGLKVNGAGAGHFTYRVPWPADLAPEDIGGATLRLEASAKQLFGKDREQEADDDGNYMRGAGLQDPSQNPNAYPMTDEERFPSAVTVQANGVGAGRYELADDPADHRGILSWHSQLRDRKLREAGSYGYLLEVPLPPEALRTAAETGTLELRLEVSEALPGGLAIYGADFGRYPLDPSVVITLKGTATESR